jgi:gingipain R
MNVTHVAQVPLGTTSLTVNCDVEGALICVSQNNQILGRATVSGGSVNSTFAALTSDQPLTVTATKQNYRPYQGPVQVGNGPLGIDELTAAINMYPNPANAQVQLVSSDNTLESAELITLTGQKAGSFVAANGQVSMDLANVAAGTYLVRIVTEKGVVTKRLEVVK